MLVEALCTWVRWGADGLPGDLSVFFLLGIPTHQYLLGF
jgi:hypothetical protein